VCVDSKSQFTEEYFPQRDETLMDSSHMRLAADTLHQASLRGEEGESSFWGDAPRTAIRWVHVRIRAIGDRSATNC